MRSPRALNPFGTLSRYLNAALKGKFKSKKMFMFPCILVMAPWRYINNSLHLARKYARIFVRGHYLFREANSFPRAKLKETCELRGTYNVQGQISEHTFAAKLRLLCLLSIAVFETSELPM